MGKAIRGPLKKFTRHINLRMTVEMKNRLDEEAERTYVSRNHVIRHIINLYFMRRGMSDLSDHTDMERNDG